MKMVHFKDIDMTTVVALVAVCEDGTVLVHNPVNMLIDEYAPGEELPGGFLAFRGVNLAVMRDGDSRMQIPEDRTAS